MKTLKHYFTLNLHFEILGIHQFLVLNLIIITLSVEVKVIVIEIIPLPLVPSLLYLLLVGLDYVQYNSYEKRFDIKVKSKSYF